MRLLGELGGGTASHTGLPPELDDEDDPDLVSLDELLAEEESDEDREDEAGWGYGEDSYGTIN
jgi:hypothetical protein